MISFKTATLAAVLGIGFVGTASAQVYPGIAGSPGRGSSKTVAVMPNGGVVSNGYMAEPGQFYDTRADRFQNGAYSLREGQSRIGFGD